MTDVLAEPYVLVLSGIALLRMDTQTVAVVKK